MRKPPPPPGFARVTPRPLRMTVIEGPLLGEYAHSTQPLSDNDTHKIIAALLKL